MPSISSVSDQQFLSNLIKSSSKNRVILSNGKTRGLIQAIVDTFKGRSGVVYYSTLLNRLKKIDESGLLENYSVSDVLSIYSRITSIGNKLINANKLTSQDAEVLNTFQIAQLQRFARTPSDLEREIEFLQKKKISNNYLERFNTIITHLDKNDILMNSFNPILLSKTNRKWVDSYKKLILKRFFYLKKKCDSKNIDLFVRNLNTYSAFAKNDPLIHTSISELTHHLYLKDKKLLLDLYTSLSKVSNTTSILSQVTLASEIQTFILQMNPLFKQFLPSAKHSEGDALDNETLDIYLDTFKSDVSDPTFLRNYTKTNLYLDNFKTILSNNCYNMPFIEKAGRIIEQLLIDICFSDKANGHWLSEQVAPKHYFEPFNKILEIYSPYLPYVSKELRSSLRVKAANILTSKSRTANQDLYLSKRRQLKILIRELQTQEDKEVDSLILRMKSHGIHNVNKLISDRSRLSLANRTKLFEFMKKETGLTEFNDFEKIGLHLSTYPRFYDSTIKRLAKSKHFFESQLTKPENEIQIPLWYHATKSSNLSTILSSSAIRYMHFGSFGGAWVSSKPEISTYGPEVFAFGDSLYKLENSPNIYTTRTNARWRGVGKSSRDRISFDKHLLFLGVSDSRLKPNLRTHKFGQKPLHVMSQAQLKAIHTHVQFILGTPNMNKAWWG